jgi:hypothetical protein
LWFPYGADHTVFYNKTECAGCGLSVCVNFKKKCIAGITVKEVLNAVVDRLAKTRPESIQPHALPDGAGNMVAIL